MHAGVPNLHLFPCIVKRKRWVSLKILLPKYYRVESHSRATDFPSCLNEINSVRDTIHRVVLELGGAAGDKHSALSLASRARDSTRVHKALHYAHHR